MEDITEDELFDGFAEQASALERGGADAICIETMTALDEACLAIKAAKEQTDLEIICTMTFEKTINDEYRTMMGITPSNMVSALLQAGADIIGTNCGNGMERMIDIVREIRLVNSSIPILVHANAGTPVVKNGKTIFPDSPEQMASWIPVIVKTGANIIGGCCGTTPEHINQIKQAIEKLSLN